MIDFADDGDRRYYFHSAEFECCVGLTIVRITEPIAGLAELQLPHHWSVAHVNQFCSNKLIALDPSSTATGYALFEGTRIHEAGLLKPKKDHAAIDRIQEMAYDLQQLVDEFHPGAAVVEIPSKHVGKRHNGKGAGLAIYGVAVGYLLAVTTSLVDHVLPVDAQEWTASGKKSDRVAVVKSLYPQYDPDGDPGSDVADAVSLGLWYLNRERMQAAV